MSIPLVLPWQNPYAVFSTAVDSVIFPKPAQGFQERLIALFVLMGLALALAVVHLAMIFYEAKQRGSSALWLFRLVRRPSGRYLVTNAKLSSTLLSIVNLVVFVFYSVDSWSVFLNHGSQARSFYWWACSTFGLVLQGWLLSWGLLQAHLLTQTRYHSRAWSATSLNVLFVVGGVVLFCVVVVTGIMNSLGGIDMWRNYVILQAELQSLEPTWTGLPDLNAAIVLGKGLEAASKAAPWYRSTRMIEYFVVAFVALVICGVNVASLFLARLLRSQIRHKTKQLAERSASEFTLAKDTIDGSWQAPKDPETAPPGFSTLQFSKAGDGGTRAENQQQLNALQKVERDLISTSVVLAAFSIIGAVLCLYIAFETLTGNILIDWSTLEFSLFGVQWFYSAVLLLLFTLLNFNTVYSASHLRSASPKSLPTASRSRPVTLLAMGEQAGFSTASLTPVPTREKETALDFWPGSWDSDAEDQEVEQLAPTPGPRKMSMSAVPRRPPPVANAGRERVSVFDEVLDGPN